MNKASRDLNAMILQQVLKCQGTERVDVTGELQELT